MIRRVRVSRSTWIGVAMLVAAGCLFRSVPVAGIYCDDATPCANGATCDLVNRACVGGNTDGGGDGSTDLPPECSATVACPTAKPICNAGVCRVCAGASDDEACSEWSGMTSPFCGASGECVQCTETSGTEAAAQCGTAKPICDSNLCRKCSAHSDCDSKICKDDGTCVTSADVIYVDNNAAANCSALGPGTFGMTPFCQIQQAITTGGKTFISVAGSAVDYGSAAITSGNFTIVGFSQNGQAAKFKGADSVPNVSITAASGTFVFDSVELIAGGAMHAGINCNAGPNGPSVVVRRSLIEGINGVGISSNNCDISVDSTVVTTNSGGGISLNDSPYAISNSIIASNGGGGTTRGLSFAGTSSIGTFRHNTVVSNVSNGAVPAGINCSNANPIENSIVWNNTTSGGVQTTSCEFTFVNINDTSLPPGAGNRNITPTFVSPGTDFRLTKPNDCCIDQIDSSPITRDIDGRLRPQGPKFDIGAHEVP